ncbi:MAG: hypothetical protein CME64_00905 [Halobacteriovoraceae bacterium]|mgnify:FL=1|nr:hypothetical protein [Halobacteriovoraceae bacterium]|tara:strand:+ start:2798 stop:3031 length:234 start_codon:yes stop_codon:yes gene_type:complete
MNILLFGRLFDNGINKQNKDENDKWLNTDEAAYYLNISSNALRILVHRAKVRAYKLGSRLRFKKSDLCSVLQLKEDC